MVKVCDQNGFGSIGRMLLGLHMMVISKMMMIAVFMVMNVNFRETVEDIVNNFYGGDEGIVEPSGKTRRTGLDVSVRYQVNPWLYLDTDVNLTKPRSKEEPDGENYIPLAPVFTSIGGLTFQLNNGLNGSLRYRFISDRPANEDNSVVAQGYFLADAVLKYTRKKFEISLIAENILNTEWKEAQFDTESRLYDEPEPVSEIHFTPGTPFFIKAGLSFFF